MICYVIVHRHLLMSATRLLPACGTLNAAKTDTKHIPIFGVSFPPFAKQWPRTKCLHIEIPLDKWVDYAVTTKGGFGVPVWDNKVLIDNIEILKPDGVLLAVDASEKLANLTSGANIQLQPGALVLMRFCTFPRRLQALDFAELYLE